MNHHPRATLGRGLTTSCPGARAIATPQGRDSIPPSPAHSPPQAQQRDLTVRRVKETEKELNRQLRQQKEQYEATIQRHLSFIDQVTVGEAVLAQ